MRLKSFYAKTMSEAMRMVKETLGDDAIIVATKEEAGGASIRVTAAVEDDTYDDPDAFYNENERGSFMHDTGQADDSWEQEIEEDEEQDNAVIETLTDTMIRHRVPSDLTDQILSCASIVDLMNPRESLYAAVEHLFHFRPLPKTAARKPLMLVGPPGVGKTLATAKMAARAVMSGLSVHVITTDINRAGGYEQLNAFTRLLKLDLERATGPDELKTSLKKAQGTDLILIDTAGSNPFSTVEMRDLARMISVGAVDPVLAMPAGMDPDEAGDIAKIFATIGTKWILPTRLDIARRLGGILSAAHSGGMSFADASNTPQVAEGLMAFGPQTLVSYLMPEHKQSADRYRQKKKTQAK